MKVDINWLENIVSMLILMKSKAFILPINLVDQFIFGIRLSNVCNSFSPFKKVTPKILCIYVWEEHLKYINTSSIRNYCVNFNHSQLILNCATQ